MIATCEHLMQGGLRVVYGYTQSDEISLLMHLEERSFGRTLRKYLSVLAGEASGKCSVLFGEVVAFDCRISELPNAGLVVEYFRWRQEDAARNALAAHCTWALRAEGRTGDEAARQLAGLALADRHDVVGEVEGPRAQPVVDGEAGPQGGVAAVGGLVPAAAAGRPHGAA
jgi:tRNA(His) guanylyltransferase